MKKLVFITAILGFQTVEAQKIGDLLKKASNMALPASSGLSADEIAGGLKEALQKGAQTGTAKLSSPGGFLENAALKIIMPPEAQKIESTLRKLGFNQLMDDMIVSMNRAAEDACKTAVPIFTTAIKEMTITDGINILRGSDTSATSYLRTKTNTALAQSFSPIIKTSLDKVNATQYWEKIITTYNKVPLIGKKMNPDLVAYVTDKSLSGIYTEIASQEKDIRANPAARTSALLQKVFTKK
ncbi:MAG: DUF4197 domain-containing protein [Sediminibacterium sp.]|jgi:hypothetical protein|nr:DUF4197 domain-containing protein [Sediminibacterium sp.]